MRPCAQPRAEGAADEGRDDADVLRRNAEHGGDLVGRVVHPLRLVPEGQAVAVPGRDGGVHLDRVVVLARDHIGLVDLDLGGRERSFGIAAPCLRRSRLSLIGLLLRRQNRLDAGDVGGRRFGRVGDAHQRRRMVRLFEGLGDHEGDRLALMVHPVVLEHVQALTDSRVRQRPCAGDRRAAARCGGSGRRRRRAPVPPPRCRWKRCGRSRPCSARWRRAPGPARRTRRRRWRAPVTFWRPSTRLTGCPMNAVVMRGLPRFRRRARWRAA